MRRGPQSPSRIGRYGASSTLPCTSCGKPVRAWRAGCIRRHPGAHQAPSVGSAWNSTASRVSAQVGLLEAGAMRGDLGECHEPAAASTATIRSALSPVTLSASGPAAVTVAPAPVSTAGRVGGGGRAQHHSVAGDGGHETHRRVVSARIRPRPMTIRWWATSSSSLIRWLEIEHRATARGERAQEAAHPDDALRVHAVERLVHQQHRRVAEHRRSDPQALPHAEGVATGLSPRGRPEPDEVDDLVDPARPANRASAPATAGGCGRCGWAAPHPRRAAHRPRTAAPEAPRSGACRPGRCRPSTASRPRITRIVVDFPAPFGPTNPVISPPRHGERHVVQRDGRAVPLAQARYLDGGALPCVDLLTVRC